MKKILTLFLTVILAFSFCSCKEDIDLQTGVTYSAYSKDESGSIENYVSFYMTSNKETEGVWEYTIEGDDIFETIDDNEENKEFKDGIANYKTLILKAKAEGCADITFSLGSAKRSYSIVVDKTSEDKMEMQVMEVSE